MTARQCMTQQLQQQYRMIINADDRRHSVQWSIVERDD